MSSLPIPREHGAYVVLVACWALGLMAAGRVEALPTTLSLIAALAAFGLTEPARLLIAARRSGRGETATFVRWIAALGAVAALASGALVWLRPEILWLAPPVVAVLAVYLRMLARRASMADLSFVGFAGLSLAGPLGLIAANPDWQPETAIAVWLFAAIFFAASAWCVRIRLVGGQGLRAAALAHGALIGATVAFVATSVVAPLALLAIAPAVIRFVWVTADIERYRHQPLKRIGLVETLIALGLVVAGMGF